MPLALLDTPLDYLKLDTILLVVILVLMLIGPGWPWRR